MPIQDTDADDAPGHLPCAEALWAGTLALKR